MLLISFVFAQTDKRDYDNELRYQNKAINALKKEIEQLRSKNKKAESQERSASNRITSLDEEIALTSRLIQSLKKEEEKTRSRIMQLKEDLLKNENELEILRVRYEQRVVNAYLKGRLTHLEKVFSSTTWRQAMYRTHYLKIISDIEKKLTKQIEKLLIEISQQKSSKGRSGEGGVPSDGRPGRRQAVILLEATDSSAFACTAMSRLRGPTRRVQGSATAAYGRKNASMV